MAILEDECPLALKGQLPATSGQGGLLPGQAVGQHLAGPQVPELHQANVAQQFSTTSHATGLSLAMTQLTTNAFNININ
eukprot:9404495-Lingulodinium_polyedra.AAC.1